METLQKLPIFRSLSRQPNSSQPPAPSLQDSPPQPQPPPPPRPLPTAEEHTSITSARSLRQLSIFFLGATCFLASTTLTRRAIHKRHLRLTPKFYAPNTNPHEHFSPLHDAAQALNLATINCVSLGTMGVGGALWAFDISGLEEARSALRGRLGYEAIYRETGGEPPRGVLELLAAAGETRLVGGEGEEGKGKESEER